VHSKLGLLKNFVMAGPAFRYLAEKFPGISAANIKEGVFVGPQNCGPFRDDQFNRILRCNEKRT
jgi:hypothetical protein